ncbi:T-related protein-like [Tropilaelaps mercedesae]|uniref:T-related protein-like n=1 Tax=Tropilaelaps mercedesae TaxID=418985 RepID=A0A1V9XVM6_9ACAR|nr:T-related protein-like [Tropilaelaps mercedesae]
MFPVIRVQLSGLESSARYSIRLELNQIGTNRYKFHGTEWVASGKGEVASSQSVFRHQDSPNTGAFWMKGPVAFNKAKLTNKPTADPRYIVLNSLHVYEPRVIIVREEIDGFGETPISHHRVVCSGQAPISTLTPFASVREWSFPLRETQFVAVTAYQNERVTQLKVRHNPFAKAFLDSRNGDESLLGTTVGQYSLAAQQTRHVQLVHQQTHQQQNYSLEHFPAQQQYESHVQHQPLFHTTTTAPLQRTQPSHNSDPTLSDTGRAGVDFYESALNTLPSTSTDGHRTFECLRWSSSLYHNPPPSEYWKNEAFRVFPPTSVQSVRPPSDGVTPFFVTSQASISGMNPTNDMASQAIPTSNSEIILSPPSPVPAVPMPFLSSSSFGFPYIHFVEDCEPPPTSNDLEQL